MLILTRRMGESLTIGDNAEVIVTLLSSSGGQAKLGITAPKQVPVHRNEIFQRIQQQKLQEKSQEEK